MIRARSVLQEILMVSTYLSYNLVNRDIKASLTRTASDPLVARNRSRNGRFPLTTNTRGLPSGGAVPVTS